MVQTIAFHPYRQTKHRLNNLLPHRHWGDLSENSERARALLGFWHWVLAAPGLHHLCSFHQGPLQPLVKCSEKEKSAAITSAELPKKHLAHSLPWQTEVIGRFFKILPGLGGKFVFVLLSKPWNALTCWELLQGERKVYFKTLDYCFI